MIIGVGIWLLFCLLVWLYGFWFGYCFGYIRTGLGIWVLVWLYGYWFGYMVIGLVIWLLL